MEKGVGGRGKCVDENTVLGARPEHRLFQLVCKVPFKGPLEVDLDMEAMDSKPLYNCGVVVGDLLETLKPKTGYIFWFGPQASVAGINIDPGRYLHVEPHSLLNAGHFRIQAWDDAYLYYPHDGEFSSIPSEGIHLGSRIELLIASAKGDPPGRARFSNIRIRKLDAPAPPMGKDADRITYFDKRIAEHPEDAFLHFQRGQCYRTREKLEKAQADFRKATELDPGLAAAHLAWARVAYQLHDIETTVARLGECLKLRPDDRDALLMRAWLLSSWGDAKIRNGKLALKDATRLCQLTNFENVHACELLACAHAENGNFDEAVKWAKKAIEVTSNPGFKKTITDELRQFEAKKAFRLPLPESK